MRRLRRRAAARGTRHGRSDNSRIGHFLLQPLPLRVDSSDVEMRDQPLNPHPAAEPAREPSAGVESPADRRRSPRATYRVVFNIYPLPGGAGAQAGGAVEVVLQDLSLVGMGIIHSTALQMGQQYQIPLVRGRDFDNSEYVRVGDVSTPEAVQTDILSFDAVIVATDLATKLWGEADPIGRRLVMARPESAPAGPGATLVVVGVVDAAVAGPSNEADGEVRAFVPY